MAKPISKLAARFAQAITQEQRDAEAAKAQAEAQAKLEAERAALAAAATKELFAELSAFAKEVPGVTATKRKDGCLVLKHASSQVLFRPGTAADRLQIEHSGGEDALFASFAAAEVSWVLHHGQSELPFYDQGFEFLCVEGLGLPAPEGYSPPEPEPEPEPTVAPEMAEAPAGDVRQVLAARRQDKRNKLKARGHTTVIGSNASPWDIRPSNPAAKPSPTETTKAAETPSHQAGDYNLRPVHTEAETPRRKRKFQVESGIGAAVKPYKPILD